MIEKCDWGEFVLSCDHCGDREKIFEDFQDAVDYGKNKNNGWRTIKDKNGNRCALCQACNTPEIIRELKGMEDL